MNIRESLKINQRLNKKGGIHSVVNSHKTNTRNKDKVLVSSKGQSVFLWVLITIATLFSSYIFYQWLVRPPSVSDLIPTAWPTFSEIKQNVQLAINGYSSGYLRTIKAYATFMLLSLSFIFMGKSLLKSDFFKDIYEILSRTERISLSFLIGSLFFSILWLVLGSIGILNNSIAVAMGILGTIGFVIQTLKSKGFSGSRISKSDKWFWWVLIGCLLVYSTVTIMSQIYSDTLLTHLALPNMYIQNGSIQGMPHNIYTYFPQNTEMLVMWCLLLKSEMGAALIMIGFLASLLMFSWGFIRRTSTTLAAFSAVILLCTSPTIIWFAGTIKNDFPSGVFLLAHFFCLVASINERGENNQLSTKWMFLAGLLAGGAMGHKFTAIITVFSSIIILLWICNREKSYKKVALYSIGFGVSILPWLLRSLILTGDPIYPYLNSFLGREMVALWHSTDMISSSTQSWSSIVEYFKLLLGMSYDGPLIHPPTWGPSILLVIATISALLFSYAPKSIKAVSLIALISWSMHLYYSVEVRYHIGFLAFLTCVPFLLIPNKIPKGILFTGFCFIGTVFLSSILYSSQQNKIPISLSKMLSGYSPGNTNLATDDKQASNVRWLAHLINTRTLKSDGILLAGVFYSHTIKRRLYVSNDRDKQIIIKLLEESLNSEDFLDKIVNLGISHILIANNFFNVFLNHSRKHFRMKPIDADKFRLFIDKYTSIIHSSPDGELHWYALSGSDQTQPILFNQIDIQEQPKAIIDETIKLYRGGDLEKAQQICEMALGSKIHPFNKSIIYSLLGAISYSKNDHSKSIEFYNSAIQIAPNSPDPYINLARFYHVTGKSQEKIKELIENGIKFGGINVITSDKILSKYIDVTR